MSGLLFFVGLCLYLGTFFYLAKLAPTRTLKFAVIVVGLGIPLWDLPIGYANYRIHCDRDGGLHVFTRNSGSDSIYVDGVGCVPQQLAKIGFRLIECQSPQSDRIVAFAITDKGIERSIRTDRISPFKLASITNQPMGWNLFRRDVVLSRAEDSKKIAQHTEFFWNGLWWHGLFFPNSGDVAHCHARGDEQLWRIALKGSA